MNSTRIEAVTWIDLYRESTGSTVRISFAGHLQPHEIVAAVRADVRWHGWVPMGVPNYAPRRAK